jgi:K+-sensing histidine kinase KdpD
LYAIGVVGAIAINIGSTGTDRALKLENWIRVFMIVSAVLLFLVEATIAIEKTKAVIFASSILVLGLSAREFARRRRVAAAPPVPAPALATAATRARPMEPLTYTSKVLVAVRGHGDRLLRYACEEAQLRKAMLFVLNVRPIAVTGDLPYKIPAETIAANGWMQQVCSEYKVPFRVISILSPEVAYTIAEHAATLGVDRLILGSTQRSLVEQALRGDVIRTVSELVPEEIQLVIYRA